jgi:hypothetical protein
LIPNDSSFGALKLDVNAFRRPLLFQERLMSIGRPNAEQISEHGRTVIQCGSVSAESALQALNHILDGLRGEYKFSFHELEPITRLIAELKNKPLEADLSAGSIKSFESF